MNRLSKEAIDPKEALRVLPPLIKGYLRLGAYIGDGAVVDHEFGTTDVLIVLPVSAINAALYRALRFEPLGGVSSIKPAAATLPRPDGFRSFSKSSRRAGASAKYFRAD